MISCTVYRQDKLHVASATGSNHSTGTDGVFADGADSMSLSTSLADLVIIKGFSNLLFSELKLGFKVD
jgi:hypothetical protein